MVHIDPANLPSLLWHIDPGMVMKGRTPIRILPSSPLIAPDGAVAGVRDELGALYLKGTLHETEEAALHSAKSLADLLLNKEQQRLDDLKAQMVEGYITYQARLLELAAPS